MPTYSSFIFSDKEKNDIKKLHESYRMSYGRLIKELDDAETDELNLAEPVEGDGSLDSGTSRKTFPLKDLKKMLWNYDPPVPNLDDVTDMGVLIHRSTIHILYDKKWYKGYLE